MRVQKKTCHPAMSRAAEQCGTALPDSPVSPILPKRLLQVAIRSAFRLERSTGASVTAMAVAMDSHHDFLIPEAEGSGNGAYSPDASRLFFCHRYYTLYFRKSQYNAQDTAEKGSGILPNLFLLNGIHVISMRWLRSDRAYAEAPHSAARFASVPGCFSNRTELRPEHRPRQQLCRRPRPD